MKKSAYSIICCVVMLQSCVLDQTYTIHEDGSGSFELTLDMKELLGMGDGDQKLSDTEDFQNTDSLLKSMPSTPGISNMTVDVGDSDIHFTLDCESWKALSKLQSNLDDDQKAYKQGVDIKTKGKKVSIDCREMLRAILETGDDEMDEMDMGIMNVLTMNFHFNFDMKIKKVKGEVAVWDKESNSIHFTYDVDRSPEDYTIKVWLK